MNPNEDGTTRYPSLLHKKCFKIGHLEHNDVIKWKYFPCYRPFVRGIHRGPVDSPHRLWKESAGQCVYTQCWSVLASAEHCIGVIFIDFIDLIRLQCWPVRVQICKWGFHFPVLTRALCSLTSADLCIFQCCPMLTSAEQCECRCVNEVSSADQWALRITAERGMKCWPVWAVHAVQCWPVRFLVLASVFLSVGQCIKRHKTSNYLGIQWETVNLILGQWGYVCGNICMPLQNTKMSLSDHEQNIITDMWRCGNIWLFIHEVLSVSLTYNAFYHTC